MLSALSSLRDTLLGTSPASEWTPGMPCSICNDIQVRDALAKIRGRSNTYADLMRIRLEDFSRKCSRGEACDVCALTGTRFLEMDQRLSSERSKNDDVIIFVRVDGPVRRLMYRNCQHHLDVSWIIREDDIHLVEEDPIGWKTFGHVALWMDYCGKHHPGCSRPKPDLMPTRLLDVGDEDSPCLRLVSGRTSPGKYVALSHCWGGSQPLITTRDNVREFHVWIDAARLPKTFADAVRVARRLGIRYVWIDSLCIIQHDDDDWAEESSKMESVYGNADLTIIASRSSSPTEGFLSPRTETVVVKEEVTETGDAKTFYMVNREYDSGIPSQFVDREPLSRRAWAVQERWLSPRALMFTRDQIVWECNEMMASESDPLSMVPRSMDRRPTWTETIEHFTACDITKEYDTLPAFAGIARAVAKQKGHTYCAGIWVENFVDDLLWYPACRGSTSDKIKRQSFVAPSFSWAASQGEVHFKGRDKASRCYWLASYIGHDQKLQKGRKDQYGALESAWLALRGAVVQVTRVEDSNTGYVQLHVRLETGKQASLDGNLDHRETCGDPILRGNDVFILPLYVTGYQGGHFSGRDEREDHRLESLILARVAGQPGLCMFRRIGICRTLLFDLVPKGDWRGWGLQNLKDSSERNEAFRLFLNDAMRQMQDIVMI
ncbi:heterokaryon incompatibility protein-domain-containing protein [Thelonectria olida]|uniref:Heterokaryon incompatibility protein-domain-containing protein n=1 Tax=Thelonectria olida TaxID=1576542 RepID=A0A9P8W3P9_9HYPO|nr:heterokaryon incompatibility protein-domain-containing protein [Thelonectria olida]